MSSAKESSLRADLVVVAKGSTANLARQYRWAGVAVAASLLVACGSDETPPGGAGGAGGSGGVTPTAGASSAGAATGTAGTAGSSFGGASGGQDLDAGGIRYPDPTPTLDPPEVGDTLRDEDAATGAVDAGVPSADAGGVSVGEVDPEYGYASACLHVDLSAGSYQVVPDAETPDPRLERVLLFASTGGSFSLLGIHPWDFSFVEPAAPGSPLPTGSPLVVDVFRDAVVLRITLVLGASSVTVRSIVVEAI